MTISLQMSMSTSCRACALPPQNITDSTSGIMFEVEIQETRNLSYDRLHRLVGLGVGTLGTIETFENEAK